MTDSFKLSNDPCLLCGKHPRCDYDGICMDCADEMQVSEIFQSNNPLGEAMKKVFKDNPFQKRNLTSET